MRLKIGANTGVPITSYADHEGKKLDIWQEWRGRDI